MENNKIKETDEELNGKFKGGVIPSLIPAPHNIFPGGLAMSLHDVNS